MNTIREFMITHFIFVVNMVYHRGHFCIGRACAANVKNRTAQAAKKFSQAARATKRKIFLRHPGCRLRSSPAANQSARDIRSTA